MFKIYVVYECKPGKAQEFVKRVTDDGIADAIRNEDGCLQYDYYLKYASDEVLLIEKWESADHQKVHMTQPHMAELKKISGECVANVTVGKFHTENL